jgi:hypothetical protein
MDSIKKNNNTYIPIKCIIHFNMSDKVFSASLLRKRSASPPPTAPPPPTQVNPFLRLITTSQAPSSKKYKPTIVDTPLGEPLANLSLSSISPIPILPSSLASIPMPSSAEVDAMRERATEWVSTLTPTPMPGLLPDTVFSLAPISTPLLPMDILSHETSMGIEPVTKPEDPVRTARKLAEKQARQAARRRHNSLRERVSRQWDRLREGDPAEYRYYWEKDMRGEYFDEIEFNGEHRLSPAEESYDSGRGDSSDSDGDDTLPGVSRNRPITTPASKFVCRKKAPGLISGKPSPPQGRR